MAIAIPYNVNYISTIDYLYPAFLANHIIAVFANKSKSQEIKTYADLKGMRGVAFVNKDGLKDDIKNFMATEKGVNIFSSDYDDAKTYNYLLENRFSYILTSLYNAELAQDSLDIKDYTFLSEPIITKQLFIAFSKNSRCRVYSKYFEDYLNKLKLADVEELFFEHREKWLEKNKKEIPFVATQKAIEKNNKKLQSPEDEAIIKKQEEKNSPPAEEKPTTQEPEVFIISN